MTSPRLALSALLLALALPAVTRAQGLGGGNVKASLLAEHQTVQPGKAATLALRMQHNEKFHTYWVNPGDVGAITKVDWTLPEGWTAGAFAWPAPHRLLQEGFVNLVFEGDLVLPFALEVPANAAEGVVEIKGKAKWLECSDTCIPGKADLVLTLTIKNADPAPDPAVAPLFAAARARLPVTPEGYAFGAAKAGSDFVLTVRAPEGVTELAKPDFFPVTKNAVSLTNAFPWVKGEAGYTLTLPMEEDAPEVIEAVLVPSAPWPGVKGESVAVRVKLGEPLAAASAAKPAGTDTTAKPAATPATPADADKPTPVTFALLLGAFLGGLILNLMPCVFPVISLKVMGFVQQAHGDSRKAMGHGLVFSLGVLVSFWVFAAIILALKGTVGWGFQLQDYRVPVGMAFLFTLLALNFFGVFEFGQSLTGIGMEAQAKEGYSGSFTSGVLAVLVATPCTGPFMGGAIGAALNQPGPVTVVIFTLLGLGMSLPYLLLGAFPNLLRFVPRPGEWMNTFKQFLGFLMLGTAVFMMHVLSTQKPASALVWLFIGLLIASLGAWVYGRWGGLERTRGQRGLALCTGLFLVTVGVVAAFSFEEQRGLEKLKPGELEKIVARGYAHHDDFTPAAQAELVKRGVAIHWQPWSAARLAELRAQGKPVFVDFTASWCAICQQNKASTFHREAVEKAFVAKGVVTLHADFSNEDEVIRQELKRFDRAGVPLYLLYGKDPSAPPAVLPNVMSPGIVLEALEKL